MSLNKQIFSTLFPYLPAQKGSANPFEYRTAAFNPAEPFPYPAERNEPLVNRTPSWNPNPSDDDELLRQRQIAELGHEIQTLGGTANVPLGNIQSEDPLWSTVVRPPVMDGGGLVYNSSPPDEPTPSFEQYQNEQREQVALGQPRIQGSVLPSPDDLKKKKIKLPPPVFVPNPNSTPAQNKYDEAVFKVNNPVNQDKGWKGRIKEIVGNFLYGMGQTPQGVGIGGALLMGGIGATAGSFNRNWNERRRAEAALPGAYQNLKVQTDIASENARTANILAQPGDRAVELARKIAKDEVHKQIEQDKLDFKIEVASQLAVLRNREVEARIAGKIIDQRQAQQKIDELIRNNRVKDENEDNRNDTSREKGKSPKNVPLPPVAPRGNIKGKIYTDKDDPGGYMRTPVKH